MRLTLRTLLAYLDDRLAPTNARELGQKVANSPFATELADRIRNVLRRRRLASDDSAQKVIDANLIAEYLDDQLTPELVGLIEKEILASDHSLAEVAASHQIIGMLSDPVELEPRLKDRLYALAPAKQTSDEGGTPAESTNAGAEWKPLAPEAPQTKRSPMILLLVMVIGWLALLATDSNLFQNSPVPPLMVVDQGDIVEGNLPDVDDADTPAQVRDTDDPDPDTVAQADAPASPPVAPVTPDDPEDTGGEVMPDPANVTETNQQPPQPDGGNSTAPTEPTSPQDTRDEPDAPQTVADLTLEVDDKFAMLAIGNSNDEQWVWASTLSAPGGGNWTPLLSANVAAVAEPFKVSLTASESGWRSLILGSSVFQAVSEPQMHGLNLYRGRVILQQSGTIPEPDIFHLHVGNQMIALSVPAEKDRIGILVQPLPAPDRDVEDAPVEGDFLTTLPLNNDYQVFIHAADNDVVVRSPTVTTPLTIKRGATLVWNTASDTPLNVDTSNAIPVPNWVYEATQPITESTRSVLTETAAGFRAEKSIAAGIAALSLNRNPELAANAIRLPAVLGMVEELVGYLLQSGEATVRREAIIGLQQTFLSSAAGRRQIETAVGNSMSELEMDNALRMLGGITPTAAEDRYISEWLVSMLDSNRLALRELAIFNLERLTGERYGYFAGDDAGRRDTAVRRWERFVDRNDGRLIQPPE